MSKLRFRLKSSVQRYIVIGVSVYLFELLVIVAAQRLGASSVAAVGISFWLGLLVSFSLQKVITFSDKRMHHRILLPQIAAFCLLVLFNFGFTVWLTSLLQDTFSAVWCRTLALMITTSWNFYLYKTRIFAAKKKKLAKRAARKKSSLAKSYRAWRSRPRIKRLRKFASRPKAGKWYLGLSLLVLFATTLLWSGLGARLQQSNADQLVNPRLFDGWATFQEAAFPGSHTFLLKWPLFYVIKLLGYTPSAFFAVTVLAVIATVAALVYIMWRIEKRPLVLGTLCLMLASVLLLVPAQPYAGALLPANMAMLATRNLEYVLYVAALVSLAKARGIRSWEFAGAAGILGLLTASDRLFLTIGLLGALLGMVFYALQKSRELANLATRWLLAVSAGLLAALAAVSVISSSHLTRIVGSQAGPYGLVPGLKSLALGIFYAGSGLLTNFGANPAYDAVSFRQIPGNAADHMLSPAGPAFVVNFLIFLLCLYAAVSLMLSTSRGKTKKIPKADTVKKLSVMLLWSSIAAICLFIVTSHYYQVDARYLTLCLFALFVILAGWLRPRRVDAELIAVCAPLLLLGILFGIIGSIQTYSGQKQALESLDYRNKVIAQTLANHPSKVLVGDYWRVFPVQSLVPKRQQQVLPLEDCTQPRTGLASKAWQADLRHTGFAYLLSFSKGQTGYPGCSLEQVVGTYGVPNSSVLIDGSLLHPKEILLFYDGGTHFPKTLSTSTDPSQGILPVKLDALKNKTCNGPAVMNITAHQDDDLLFMNPDLQHAIDSGHCVRSVYLTAGDAGRTQPYWLSRELGSEAAYSIMTGAKAAWMQHTVQLPGGQFATVAGIRGNNRISLVFIHVPDGNLNGQGFRSSRQQSLAELESGRIAKLQTVDGQSSYTKDQLVDALASLIKAYQPSEIRTQSDFQGMQYKDHSDHRTAGMFALQAYQQSGSSAPLTFYMGYPVHELPPNVDGVDFQRKESAFNAYSIFDHSVCHTHARLICQQNPVYDIYLARQYRQAD